MMRLAVVGIAQPRMNTNITARKISLRICEGCIENSLMERWRCVDAQQAIAADAVPLSWEPVEIVPQGAQTRWVYSNPQLSYSRNLPGEEAPPWKLMKLRWPSCFARTPARTSTNTSRESCA